MSPRLPLVLVACLVASYTFVTACAATGRDLGRATAEFDDARYEAALAWLDELRLEDLSHDERATYAYLRGMAELRLGHRDEGLHWLRVARVLDGPDGRALRSEWRTVLSRSLAELEPTTATHHARARDASSHE